ncbi:complement factor H-like isoform X2 [Anoplopoma fimbria]|uniref:complement factor H-like isoform X2 n=1 Tax=Anoplopoma fimbria TaxID=229290 RepID=UPI0023ECEFBB|nr:complement factor H-like isoform X2 [Anoplopoma fimbria]
MHLMHLTRSCVLLLCTLTLVKSQDTCTREQFFNGDLFDSNFDTTDLEATYLSGKQVRVGCNVGYSGFFKLICVGREWQSRGKPCQPKSCGHPGDAQFADFHLEKGQDFVFGSQVVYTCHKGYQMVSRTNNRHCLDQGWDGVVPVCEAQQCRVIHVDNNVQVVGDLEEATYGNVVRFSCKSRNEMLSGSQEMYCDENGEWRGQAPICKEVTCTEPEIENGRVLEKFPEYKENEVLNFQCNLHHKRTEGRPSTCTKRGTGSEWSPTPACELITCRLTLPPLEGTRYDPSSKNKFSPGDTVRVICGEKYWVSTRQDTTAVNTCQGNGEWTFTPVCQEFTCSDRRPQHVSYWYAGYLYQRKLDKTVSYWCAEGYKKTANLATCTRDDWKPNPLCQEITCNRHSHPDADIARNDKNIYRSGERVDYTCKDGYEGRFTLTCGKTGWIGNPQCKEITCNRHSHPDADIARNDKNIYRYDEQVDYICKDGNKGRFTLTCGETGWIGNPQCVEITCNKQSYPDADIARNDRNIYRYDDRVDYICKNGYEGEFTLTCGETGWIGDAKCIGRQCKRPHIDKAQITSTLKETYSHNEHLEYACTNNTERVFTVTCEKGVWTGISYCSGCPTADVHNGFVVGPYNDTLYYTCKNGYELHTEGWWAEAKCNDGIWSGLDHCFVNNTCGEIPVIPNGNVTPRRGENNARITCNEGYRPRVNSLTCHKGKWLPKESSPETICTPTAVPCNPPPKVDNAVVVGSYQKEYLSDSEVTYQCRDKYVVLDGEDTIRCNNGQWEEKNITCTPPTPQ